MNSDSKVFNSNAQIYNEVRPGYPEEVYSLIAKYKNFSKESTILEIGSGNGLATKEIWRNWKSNITAIEPGKQLWDISNLLFSNNSKISILNSSFENYNSDLQFDGIFSATAFHWLDSTTKYISCHKLLKNDGILVLYWNNYGIADEKIEKEVQNVYKKYGFKNNGNRDDILNIKSEKRKNEIELSGLFHLQENTLLYRKEMYGIEKYIKLLRTFPDHTESKKPKIESMFDEIRQIGNKYENMIPVRIVVDLKIARKS